MRRIAALVVVALVAAASPASADGELPPRVTVPQREEESWSFLRASAMRRDAYDPIKYIELGDDPAFYLTLGGEAREYLETYRHDAWNAAAPTDSYLLQRYLAHGDVHVGRYLRAFVQLESSFETGRAGGPRPQVDRDRLDLLQAWSELAIVPADSLDQRPQLSVRVGRQELTLGAGRLVSIRELNVRAPWDGARPSLRRPELALDAYWFRPITIASGVLDDREDHTQSQWGVYATGRLAPAVALDVYYLGLSRDAGVYARGVAPETRHTVGGRAHLQTGAFDGEVEAAGQVGTFGPHAIRAWMAVATADYTVASLPGAPTLGLVGAGVSGDQGGDHALGSFNVLSPRGDHFGATKLLGPSNLLAVDEHVVVHLGDGVVAAQRLWVFTRASTHDGLYNIAGFPLPMLQPSTARYVGTQVQGELGWRVDAHLEVDAVIARFFAGAYLQQAKQGVDTTYLAPSATYRI